MTASINASTSAGVVVTSDTSGSLALQTAGTTAVTISSSQVVTLANALPITSGGTNSTATPTSGGVVYGTGTAYAFTSFGTTGYVLTSQGSGAPIWAAAAVTGPTIGLVRAIAINCIFP